MACEAEEMDMYCELVEIAELNIEEIEKIRLACYCIIDIIESVDKVYRKEMQNVLKNALIIFISIFIDDKKMMKDMESNASDNDYYFAMESLKQLI